MLGGRHLLLFMSTILKTGMCSKRTNMADAPETLMIQWATHNHAVKLLTQLLSLSLLIFLVQTSFYHMLVWRGTCMYDGYIHVGDPNLMLNGLS